MASTVEEHSEGRRRSWLSCVQALVPQAELQDLVQSYPAYSYVVDFSGDAVAALVSRPVEVMLCIPSGSASWREGLVSMQAASTFTSLGCP